MMAPGFYERLSYLDSTFLALETPTAHMHVSSVALFDAAPLRKPDGGIDIDGIRAHIAGKLPYIPRYRQRLAYVPYNKAPVWVDDADFELTYHVRHSSVPRPGTEAQLKAMAGRIMGQPLDRHKPLWEVWIVEGVEGDRFALISKIHHCMIDGVSGVDLTTITFTPHPVAEPEPAPPWHPRPVPAPTQLVVGELAKATRSTIDAMATVGEAVRQGMDQMERITHRVNATWQSLRSGWLSPASDTPLNREIGPNRRFDWTEIPLDSVKAVKAVLGGTVNDIVLSVTAGAIRHYLEVEHGFSTHGLEFRVMAPVSVRTRSQRGTLGNQVSMWLVDLPVSEPDPVVRFHKVCSETARLKASDQALGAATLVDLSRGTPIPLMSAAARIAAHTFRPFNLVVTNIPGPQFPVYLLESRMLAVYPMVPLWGRQGLGVALFSYDGRLHWGLHADYDAVPDTGALVDSIGLSMGLLSNAALA
jgi:WS/DGAT/MGAT family acyltransferase